VGQALIGADGGKSVVRAQYVNDPPRVTGHVVYRAVVDKADFPDDLQWNAASIWVGPNCHLVHYPLRGGEQYNVVVTFHSRQAEQWGVTEGSKEEVQSYFQGICPKARQLIDLPKSWKRWATADREPIGTWTFGRATLLGDAAHPTTQYMAQGACMAMEDAVTLGEALRVTNNDWDKALALYQRSRVPAPRASCCRPRDGPHLPRQGRGAPGAQRPVEGPHARSASTTPWNGCTAGTSTTAWPAGLKQPPETPHERTRPTGRPAARLPRRTHETQPGAAVAQPARGAAAQSPPARPSPPSGPTRRCARC
jgi:hypothetical protein